MIKILHSADWHLDAPMSGHSPAQADFLRRELKKIPQQIVKLAKAESCDLMLLAGDLFDSTSASAETLRNVQNAFAEVEIPVFITPGNHDYLCPGSPYEADGWPENVHIFKNTKIEEVSVPELSCKIYGAGYTSMDCPALLKGFQAAGEEAWHLGIFHGDVENAGSPYFPITREQIRTSALSYLASGHIHKGSSLRAGETLCAWPGCPMGRGYDELGTKGVILVTLDDDVKASFLPLSTPRFYDEEVEVGDNAKDAVAALLPALHTDDFYRITLTGYSTGIDLSQLSFPQIPNLILRDETRPEIDLWRSVGEDSLEGVYFGFLQQASQSDMEKTGDRAALAARISRQILDGQEVKLP